MGAGVPQRVSVRGAEALTPYDRHVIHRRRTERGVVVARHGQPDESRVAHIDGDCADLHPSHAVG